MNSRRTRQLDAVLSVLTAVPDHPTAAQLHARVARLVPTISLGTVYRNLEKLIHSGDAVAVRLGGEATRYDGMVAPHDHFVCRHCGSVADLADADKPAVDVRRLARAGFTVDSHSLAVFGLCQRCGQGRTKRARRPQASR
jgi:Fe2+ or Zn2+ uptake regulation protein